jgi:hypothetical protein
MSSTCDKVRLDQQSYGSSFPSILLPTVTKHNAMDVCFEQTRPPSGESLCRVHTLQRAYELRLGYISSASYLATCDVLHATSCQYLVVGGLRTPLHWQPDILFCCNNLMLHPPMQAFIKRIPFGISSRSICTLSSLPDAGKI